MQGIESARRAELSDAAPEQINLIKNVCIQNPAVFYLLFLFACWRFLRTFHRKSRKREEEMSKSARLNFANETRKSPQKFIAETSLHMDIFCSAHPEPLRVNGPLTCTQFMGSKPQETASCLSFTVPCCFLFVFAAHVCKNSSPHLCRALNYTEFFHLFYFLFVFSRALLRAAYRRDCSGANHTARSVVPHVEVLLFSLSGAEGR